MADSRPATKFLFKDSERMCTRDLPDCKGGQFSKKDYQVHAPRDTQWDDGRPKTVAHRSAKTIELMLEQAEIFASGVTE